MHVLGAGRTTIGRGHECDVVIDDALASRHHATIHVDDTGVWIEDHSTNGLIVNGEAVDGSRGLEPGDRLTIGAHQFVLMESRARRSGEFERLRSGSYERPPATVRPAAPDGATARANLFGLLIATCERSLAMGQIDDAVSSVGSLFLSVRAALVRGQVADDDTMERLASFAVRLAEHEGDATWIDRLLSTYGLAGRVLDVETIDRIHTLATDRGLPIRAALEDYAGKLRAVALALDPEQRARVDRIEQLASA